MRYLCHHRLIGARRFFSNECFEGWVHTEKVSVKACRFQGHAKKLSMDIDAEKEVLKEKYDDIVV